MSNVTNVTLNEAIRKAALANKNYVDTNYQPKTDEALLTNDKTVIGAINELFNSGGTTSDKTLIENLTNEVNNIKTEIVTIQEFVGYTEGDSSSTTIIELINNKVDIEDVYTKPEVDNLLQNVVKGIKVNGTLLELIDGQVNINVPVITSSSEINKILVAEDGTMEVNSLNVDRLVQDENSILVLNGGSSN